MSARLKSQFVGRSVEESQVCVVGGGRFPCGNSFVELKNWHARQDSRRGHFFFYAAVRLIHN